MKPPIRSLILLLGLTTQLFAGKTIPNYPVANLVLGQSDFTSNLDPTISTPRSLDLPASVCVDPMSGRVFVADRGNNRVLRYPNAAALSNGAGAQAVFGQDRFSTSTSASTDQGMSSPRSIFLDRFGRLWVADTSNNRVLMFEAAIYRSSSPFADRVFGQPDFTTNTSGSTASKMSGPLGVFVDSNDRLWIADDSNHRILRFDSISEKPTGAAADGVLGQTDFTSNASALSASGMDSPLNPSVSGNGTLFVADSGNDRVLVFENAASLPNGSPATKVLGQPDFVTGTEGTTASKMDFPTGTWITPDDCLWVSDAGNARTLRFSDASSLLSGSLADGVVGQPNFTTNTPSTTSRKTEGDRFCRPFAESNGRLWIPDPENNRVLRFPPDMVKPALTVTKPPKTTKKKKVTIRGKANDFYGISKVRYRVGGGKWKNASGKKSWKFNTNLKLGNNRISLQAFDAVGNKSKVRRITVKRLAAGSAPALLALD